MATIQEINHDSSTTIGDHYTSVTDTGGVNITVTAGARLDLSTNGADVLYDNSALSSLLQNITFSTDDFRYRFRIKLDNLTNSNSGNDVLEVALQTGSGAIFKVIISGNAGDSGYNATAFYREGFGKGSGDTQIGSGSDVVSSTGEVCFELRAIRETASPGSDGEAELFIDGVSKQSISNAQNRTVFAQISSIKKTLHTDKANLSGNLFYDQFLLDDDNTLSTMCTGATDGFALIAGGGQT